jgi:hypothetical protein
MKSTGAARVRRTRMIKKNKPHGLTPDRVEAHRIHKKGR